MDSEKLIFDIHNYLNNNDYKIRLQHLQNARDAFEEEYLKPPYDKYIIAVTMTMDQNKYDEIAECNSIGICLFDNLPYDLLLPDTYRGFPIKIIGTGHDALMIG